MLMNYLTTTLQTYNIDATDGEMGKIRDFYLDDRTWKIRYAIVDTRKWLPERKVLLSPTSFIGVNEENETLEVEYDKETIKKSPKVPEDSDLSREKENQLIKYFGWSRYWPDDVLISGDQRPLGVFHKQSERIQQSHEDFEREQLLEDHRDNKKSNLRSHEEILLARVHGKDGKLGKLVDFIYNDDWQIKYFIFQSTDYSKDEFYFYPVDNITNIDWFEGDFYLNETMESFQNKITFDKKQDILDLI